MHNIFTKTESIVETFWFVFRDLHKIIDPKNMAAVVASRHILGFNMEHFFLGVHLLPSHQKNRHYKVNNLFYKAIANCLKVFYFTFRSLKIGNIWALDS